MKAVNDRLSTHVDYFRTAALERARIHWARVGRPLPRPGDPVFLVGCPRSGTTLLFDLLRRHEDLVSLPREGHEIWNAYQHPRRRGWSGDRVVAEDVTAQEERFVHHAVARIAGEGRFLDKTPKNALRLPYLRRLFPDASIVAIRRDARATVGSLIEGWTRRRGISYRMPERLSLEEYRGRYWSYVLPPGWEGLRGTTIPDVAAFQYVMSNETLLDDAQRIEVDVVHVRYEDLIEDPVEQLRTLVRALRLRPSPAVDEAAGNIADFHAGAITPPRRHKWRDRAETIERVWPKIAPTAHRLGYTTERI
jgi:hypothetical protein